MLNDSFKPFFHLRIAYAQFSCGCLLPSKALKERALFPMNQQLVAWFTHFPKGEIWFHSMLHGKSHTFMVNRCGDCMQAFRPGKGPVFNQVLYQLLKLHTYVLMYIYHSFKNIYWAWLVSTKQCVQCTSNFRTMLILELETQPTTLGIEHKASSAVQCSGSAQCTPTCFYS